MANDTKEPRKYQYALLVGVILVLQFVGLSRMENTQLDAHSQAGAQSPTAAAVAQHDQLPHAPLRTAAPTKNARAYSTDIVTHIQQTVQTNRISSIQNQNLSNDLLGVTSCPSPTFTRWSRLHGDQKAVVYQPYPIPKDSARVSLGIEIDTQHCKAKEVEVRLCTTRNTPENELRQRTHGDRWAVVPTTRAIELVVHYATLAKLGHTHVCIAVKCPGACHSQLIQSGDSSCTSWGERNILLAPLPREEQQSNGPSILVMLIDSVSWRGFNMSFPKTANALQSSPHHKVSSFVNSHATGKHSSVNHPPLFLGTHVDKCLSFKSGKEGVPKKKDGEVYKAYRRLLGKVSTSYKSEGAKSLREKHFLNRFHGAGFRTGLLAPLPYMAPESTCFGMEDESDVATGRNGGFIDDIRWRFFSEAVSMFNREVNGSQGCIGNLHETDYIDAFMESFFGDDRGIAVVASQTPHQKRWNEAMIRYFDERLAMTLHRFLHRSHDSAVLLLADHGLGFGAEKRLDALAMIDEVLNPVHIWATPNGHDSKWRKVTSLLRSRQHSHVTHFDVHATLNDLAALFGKGSNDGKKAGDHALSLIQDGAFPTHRSCTEMGLFAQSCRLFLTKDVMGTSKTHEELRRAIRSAASASIAQQFGTGEKKATVRKYCWDLSQIVMDVKSGLQELAARVMGDGTCYLSGTLAVSVPRRTQQLFSITSSMVVVPELKPKFDQGGQPSNAAEQCVGYWAENIKSLRVTQLSRLSTYAEDERQCGGTLTSTLRKRNLEDFDLQLCLCDDNKAAKGREQPGDAQFLGG